MPNQRIFHVTRTDADQAEQMREVIRESRELLKQPGPDTFVGRKTQEPFPKEDDTPATSSE
jgi:hypothetical protein